MIAFVLAAAVSLLLLLLWGFRLRKTLRREREENCWLRKLLRIGFRTDHADLAQLRKLRHDLRQYLILAERAAMPAKAAALRDALDAAPSARERESGVVSALERYYLERAKELGFQADLQIALPQTWEDAIPDICLMLNNLLENAIEALQREGGGWLRARSIATAGYFSLVVGNSCTRPLRMFKGRYLSADKWSSPLKTGSSAPLCYCFGQRQLRLRPMGPPPSKYDCKQRACPLDRLSAC